MEGLKIHEMTIKPEYFDLVQTGEKIYEVRTNDHRRKAMNVGDYIHLVSEEENQRQLYLRIDGKIEFPTFAQLYDTLPKRDVGFEGQTTEQIVDALRKFYTEETEKETGVVAIKVSLVKELDLNKPKSLGKRPKI